MVSLAQSPVFTTLPVRFSVLPLVARWGLLTLLAGPLVSAAQPATAPAPPARRIDEDPVLRPKYPGGQRALRAYIAQEIRYPLTAYREHVVGKVHVRYIVDEAGWVQEPVVTKSVGFGCDEEALRIVQSLAPFRPGTNAAGQAVAVYESTIVDFSLDDYVMGDHQVPRKSDLILAGLTGTTTVPEKQRRMSRPLKAPAVAPLAGVGTLAAQYPGGLSELFVFIARQTRYPKAARKADVEGRVLVSVLIDEQGQATAPTVVEGLGYGCDDEAMRILQRLPQRFSPAQSTLGQPVAMRYEVPVFFPKMKLGKYRRAMRRSTGDGQQLYNMANPLRFLF